MVQIRTGNPMRERLESLPTEGRRAGPGLDELDATAMVKAMHRADGEALEAVRRALPEVAVVVERAAERMGPGASSGTMGRLVYCGAGTSGRLGVLDASECVPTFGVRPGMVVGLIAGGDRALREAIEGAEDDLGAGAQAVSNIQVGHRDVVVGVAASGRTPWVLGAMEAARASGSLVVGVSCVPGSAVERAGELAVTLATGAEMVTGSTRLKAGTATKLVLNMISTGVMVRLGYVYGDLMVNVRPTNAKLRDRAARIVDEICGTGRGAAEELLVEAGGDVKAAVVMWRRGVGPEQARKLLAEAGGVLRRVIGPVK